MFYGKKEKDRIRKLEEQIGQLESDLEQGLHSNRDAVTALFHKIAKDVEQLTAAMNDLKEKQDKLDEVLEDYENFSIEKALAKKSREPWAGLSVSEVDPATGRVGIKVDWNETFQEHLKRSGIPGNNDDERMSIWLTSLIKEWGEEIDEETAKRYRDDL